MAKLSESKTDITSLVSAAEMRPSVSALSTSSDITSSPPGGSFIAEQSTTSTDKLHEPPGSHPDDVDTATKVEENVLFEEDKKKGRRCCRVT